MRPEILEFLEYMSFKFVCSSSRLVLLSFSEFPLGRPSVCFSFERNILVTQAIKIKILNVNVSDELGMISVKGFAL